MNTESPQVRPPISTYEALAGMIDHSLLRPELTEEEVEQGCRLARESGFVGGEVITRATRSRVLFQLGDFPEALELAREAATMSREQLPPFAPLVLGRLALSGVALLASTARRDRPPAVQRAA